MKKLDTFEDDVYYEIVDLTQDCKYLFDSHLHL